MARVKTDHTVEINAITSRLADPETLVPGPSRRTGAALEEATEPTQATPVARSTTNATVNAQRVLAAPENDDLESILDAVLGLLTRFVVFPDEDSASVVALWTCYTWVYDHFDFAPYLAVTSAEKRSGKTRLLDVLDLLVRKPWRCVVPSEAVTFRRIERDHPTILMDEVDCIFNMKSTNYEGLRALLNAGFRRGTPVSRCVGEKLELKDFEVFCPKALAGIGVLPPTVGDRSVVIRMRRRTGGEPVARFRERVVGSEFTSLRERLEAWAPSVDLSNDTPLLPHELDDRAQDVWEPLLAVAERAGAEWQSRGTVAAVILSARKMELEKDQSPLVRQLGDLRSLFANATEDRLMTSEIVGLLEKTEDGFWSDYRQGRAVTASSIAGLLRPHSIESRELRCADGTKHRGYRAADFEDAWTRYLG